MNTNSTSRRLALLAGLMCMTTVGVSSASAADTAVYDNTTNPLDKWISASGKKEIGDEISLAGTARVVSSFVFEYFGDFTAGSNSGARAVVRFYANDGLPFEGAPRPNSLLWESGQVEVLSGFRGVSLTVPNITVPNTMTWSVEFSGLAGTEGNQAGLSISDPVSVGATLPASGGRTVVGSYSDYWYRTVATADSWALANIDPDKVNFYARVGVVPEPGTVALFSVAGAFLFLIHRRNAR